MWQWWRYATSLQHNARPILAVNLDETAVLVHHPGQKGLVWLQKSKGQRRRYLQPVQKLDHGAKRQCLTHVAMISNLPEVTKKLPHILLGNEHVITASSVPELRAHLDPSIRVWRRKSSWVNASTMQDIALELVACLAEYKESHRIVLLLDCCPCHLDSTYINTLANNGIAVVFIPAKMTWLLQPLDTHAFSSFKLAVAERYRRFLMASDSESVSNYDCIRMIGETIPEQLHRKNWRSAFHGNNFGGRDATRAEVRRSILQCLEWTGEEEIGDSLPSLELFQAVMPKNKEIPLTALFSVYPSIPIVAPLPKKAVPVLPVPVAKHANVWHGRLRSSSSLSLAPQSFPDERSFLIGSSGAASSSEPWPRK